MTKRPELVAILLVGVGFVAFSPAAEENPPVRGSKRFAKSVVVSRLANPWEVEWGPDDWLWVTERSSGRVTRVHPKTGERKPAVVIEEVRTPGGQEGLLGLTLHPNLLEGVDRDYVYVAYTYDDPGEGADSNADVAAPAYRYLYMKVVRFRYNAKTGRLSDPVDVIRGLPAGNDHNGGRLKLGPDGKLYLTIGDQGHNQLGNFCLPIESQRLPTQAEVEAVDYRAYVGKTLRLNLDGSIPGDNPTLADTVSHVYSYGHRNSQGIDLAPDGTLYAFEHGPHTDDEVNILRAGGNYGWPHVAGRRDDKFYVYARWADSRIACKDLTYDFTRIPDSTPFARESDYEEPFIEPIASLFTAADGEFEDPRCGGVHHICWPTIGPSSIEYYEAGESGVPGWEKVLFVTGLKRGSLYTVPLDDSGQRVSGPIERHLQSEDRFRDTAVSPDGRTIFVAADFGGVAEAIGGGATNSMAHPGAILAFTYEGEADGPIEPVMLTKSERSETPSAESGPDQGPPPHFTAAQAEAGRSAYVKYCAVCHGGNLTNGTYGTPLAGRYFDEKWSGKSVRALFEHAKKMPPDRPGSLEDQLYLNVLAYVFQMNGVEPGDAPLPNNPSGLTQLTIR